MNASDGTNPNENNHNPSQRNDQRKGKGRQKLPMKKIENETNLMVTFSKRRAGIFKKASELNTLCGAESALVVFSPGEKIHSYGHPSVETIANRFLNTDVGPTPPTNPLLIAHHEATNRQLNQELVHKEELLMRERQRKKELDNTFQLRINKMSYEELRQLEKDVLRFKSAFESRFKEASSISSSSSYPPPMDPNMGYMVQYPCGSWISSGASGSNALIPYNFSSTYNETLFGDAIATTSNTEITDETQTDVSNMSHGRGSRCKNGRVEDVPKFL